MRLGLLEQRDDVLDVGHVGLDRDRISTLSQGLDFCDHFFRSFGAVGVVDDDFGPAAREFEGGLLANSAT